MRTISNLPSIKTYQFFFEDLNEFIDSTKLKRRYNYNKNELNFNFIHKKNITIDTREQKPIKLVNYDIINEKLDFGDYSCDGILAVERKSLSDLVSTLSSGFDRFNREVERAKLAGGYIVVVTECDINKFLSFSYSRTGKFAKASADFIFHRFREICKNFPENIQFCFSGGRKESSDLIPKILSMDIDVVKNVDFQYLIEHKLI
jgi:ERCC4-type nuclease